MKNIEKIIQEIERLRNDIEKSDIESLAKASDWGGADVIIAGSLSQDLQRWIGAQSFEVSQKAARPNKKLIITDSHKELSWLFSRLGQICADYIDYMSKYDFYGTLADGALSSRNIHEKEVLLSTLDAAKDYMGRVS